MAVKENKALVGRIYEECFNQGDLATVDQLVTQNYQDSSPGLPPGLPATGPDNLKALVSLMRAAFPDLHAEVEEMIILGNSATVRSTWSGTHQGELLGIAPTGIHASWGSVDIVRLRDGKLASRYGLFDGLGLLRQLRAVPATTHPVGVVEHGHHALGLVKGAVGQALETATTAAQDLIGTVKARLDDTGEGDG